MWYVWMSVDSEAVVSDVWEVSSAVEVDSVCVCTDVVTLLDHSLVSDCDCHVGVSEKVGCEAEAWCC